LRPVNGSETREFFCGSATPIASPSAQMAARCWVLAALVGVVSAPLLTSEAAAQAPARFELPPAPDELPAISVTTVFFSSVFPLTNQHACPSGASCVLGGGGGIGGSVERRWASGFNVGLEYEAWFLNSGGIYEIGLMQAVTAYARHLLIPENVLHPILGVGIGGVLFGDTGAVATAGLAVNLSSGIEWEITDTVSVVAALVARILWLNAFATPTDMVERAEGFGLDATLGLRLGIAISQ